MSAGAQGLNNGCIGAYFSGITNDLNVSQRTGSVFRTFFGERNAVELGAVTGGEVGHRCLGDRRWGMAETGDQRDVLMVTQCLFLAPATAASLR